MRVRLLLLVAVLSTAACTDDNGGVVEGGPDATTGSTSTTTTVDGIDPLEGASTETVEVERNIEVAHLVDLRVARQEGFDRVVFEFDSEVPGYRVGYAERPIVQDGSGEEIEVEGEHVVEVRLFPASGVDLQGEDPVETYTGPNPVTGDTAVVIEVVRTGDFEAVLTWAVGLSDKVDFRVSELTSPSRLVVDFRNH